MSIHEHLPPQARKGLKEVGWTKGIRTGVGGAEGRAALRLCNLVAQGSRDAEGGLQAGSGKELTGKEEGRLELIYFKVYKTQIPVIEQAIETTALKLGTDKSRGYCLEMICADFLAGANLENNNPESPAALAAECSWKQVANRARVRNERGRQITHPCEALHSGRHAHGRGSVDSSSVVHAG